MEHIRLDLIPGKRPPICHASQYDDGRVVRVDLTENGEDYTLSNEVIVLDIRKGDGCVVTAACAIVSGKKYVDIVLTQQMTAVFGSNLAELQITKDGTLIGTLNFIIEVERDPLDSSIASSSVIHDLQAQVDACVDTALEERGASAVGYDNTSSGLTATNVQEAIDEVNDKIGGGMGDYYTKSETDALLDDKADKSDLNDYYTKSQADNLLSGKVDDSDLDNYYTKSEVNNAMSGKADKSNVYTKSQTDSLLAGKVDSSELGNYYTTTEVDAALNSKANKSNVYTKSETNSLLNGKVDNSALDNYYTKSQSYSKNEVDTALSGKANSSDVYDKDYMDGIFEEIDNAFTGVNTALGTKADKSTTYTKTEVNTLLSGKVDNATLNNYYTKSEVDKMIYDIYPSKTATGSIATFTTSLALPLVSAKFAIKATGGNGFTGLNVSHAGKNLIAGMIEGYIIASDGTLSSSASNNIIYAPCKAGVKYSITRSAVSTVYAFYSNIPTSESQSYNQSRGSLSSSATTVTAEIDGYLAVRVPNTDTNNQIEVGEEVTTYETPITPTVYHISWQTEAGTVYGGEVDVTSGKLKVTHQIVDLGTCEWNKAGTPPNIYFYTDIIGIKSTTSTSEIIHGICSHYSNSPQSSWYNNKPCIFALQNNPRIAIADNDYNDSTKEEFTTAMSGVQFVYELATPIEYDLTPQEITALVGVNNIWGDTNGNASVEYKQGIQEYIDAKIAETQALIL